VIKIYSSAKLNSNHFVNLHPLSLAWLNDKIGTVFEFNISYNNVFLVRSCL